MDRRIVLLTGGGLRATPKTAVNLIRYTPAEVLAVWDPANRGKTSQELFGLGGSIPVIGALDDAPQANTLVIGIAPAGGKLPPPMKEVILQGVRRQMTVISGLHEFLCDDPDIAAAARTHGARLVDVRHNNERDVARRQGLRPGCLRIHTVGHDCNVGKMIVSLELSRALQRAGYTAKFIATGQTGIMIEGDGCAVDAVVGDFINGAAEKLVLANQHHDILVVEGQGCITHPRYSAVTLGLLHGCVPDGLILCYEQGRQFFAGMETIPIPSLAVLRQLYESVASPLHPCRVIGIGLNSSRVSAPEAARERNRVRQELGLPICDVIRDGPDELVEAILDLKRALGK